jgi:acyl-CoA thioesterase-1
MSESIEKSSADAPLSRFHARIEQKIKTPNVAPVLIVALGDSVTQGAASEGLLHEMVYHAQFRSLLEKHYPNGTFSLINSGVGGETADGGLIRVERDVIRYQPDLVLIAFGLNDAAGYKIEKIDHFTGVMETLIQRIQNETDADIILLSTNMMPTHDNPNIPDQWKHVTEDFIQMQNGGVLAAYRDRIKEIGAKFGAPVADVYGGWEKLVEQGVDTTAMLLNGLNHPDPAGHRMAGEIIMDVVIAHEPKAQSETETGSLMAENLA